MIESSFGITGSREGTSDIALSIFKSIVEQQIMVLSTLDPTVKDITTQLVVRHGDCVGVDEQCHNILLDFMPTKKIFIAIHPPKIQTYAANCRSFPGYDGYMYKWQPLSYLERNDQIVEHSEILIAFPKTRIEEQKSGTWYTIRRAIRSSIPVIIIHQDGEIEHR